MSTINFKSETNACRCCLAMNRRLYCILYDKISEAYTSLVGRELINDGLPQYICNYCTIMLLKYMKFRKSCIDTRDFFHDIPKQITADTTNQIGIYSELKQTDTKLLSIYENNITYDSITERITDCDIYDDDMKCDTSPPENSDEKIFTDFIKIEKNGESKKLEIKKSNKKKKDKIKKKGKYFETKDNIREFEGEYNVDIIILSPEEQLKDVLERKLGLNYLHSPYKCELCYKGFMDEEILNKHILSQHDPSRGDIVCELCKFRYKDKRGLTQHLKSHRLKFSCRQCKYISRTTFNAKEHYKMHGGQLHRCEHCGKSYEKLSSHLSHMRIHHPSQFVWCDLCGDAFIGQFGLNAHKKRAHRDLSLPSHCTKCDKRFLSPAALRNHGQQSRDCGATRRHCCSLCGHGFDDPMQLREHLLKAHRRIKTYTCEKCNKTFTRESLYSAHYRRVHVDSEEIASRKRARPWVCEVCGKTLPNKCVLLYHQRNHTGERPYQCTQCPKSFTMRRLLQSHLRVHSDERPYACKLCTKTFKGLSALRTHEHIHSDTQVNTSKTIQAPI